MKKTQSLKNLYNHMEYKIHAKNNAIGLLKVFYASIRLSIFPQFLHIFPSRINLRKLDPSK